MTESEFIAIVRGIEANATRDDATSVFSNGMSDEVREYLLSMSDPETLESEANIVSSEIDQAMSALNIGS